jgi:hypothetical protein
MAQCAGESDASTLSGVAQWRLGQQPIVDIGVASGDPVYELTDAASSLRLDNGAIVVADVGIGELRYFDAAGRFQHSTQGEPALGRPGSVRRGRLRHAPVGVDNGVAFEGPGERLIFDARGTLVAHEAGSEPATRIHGRTLIVGGTDETQTAALRAIDLLPAIDSATGYRIVRLDDFGYLWEEGRVSDPRLRKPWLIYTPEGRLVGQAATPAAFDPQQIGPDFILGRWRDGNGIEHIRMYGLTREERIATRRDTTVAGISGRRADPARRRTASVALREALQQLALLQEGHWAKAMTYASDVRTLDLELPKGAQISIVSASVGGWRALAYDYAADAMCGIGVGRDVVAGWREGTAVCE